MPSIIDSEFRFESGNTYHATTDVVIVEGGILKHEPGAVVKWAQNTGLHKDPNGVYIARGLPSEMCINIPDVNEPSDGYWKGIKLVGEDAHTSLSEVSYSYVAYAQTAFALRDIALGKFENNFIEYNNRGIDANGPRQTRIMNNVFYGNWIGIDASPEDESGTIADPNYVIEIVGNTCHENDYGVVLSGTSLELTGITIMDRNISTASSEYNYSLWSGNLGAYFSPLFIDNGRWLSPVYPDSANTNYDASLWEYNPVEDSSNPYDPGPGYFDIVRLKRTSAFIDASVTPVLDSLQAGFTTSKNDIPDANVIDLGYHYANWQFSNIGDPNLFCDFNGDSFVDLDDLALMTEYWLEPYTPPDPNSASPDIDGDGLVTVNDFGCLSKEWLKYKSYNGPPLEVNFSDGQYGEKIISISGYDDSLAGVFLFIDGYFAKELFLEHYSPVTSRQIFVPWLKPGQHEAKIIASDMESNILCYPPQEFSVSEGISECVVPILFKMGKPLPYSASSALSEDVKVSAYCGDAEVWSTTFPAGSNIIGTVPQNVTAAYEIEYLQFTPVQ